MREASRRLKAAKEQEEPSPDAELSNTLAADLDAEVDCPDCAEKVKSRAKVCKHCGNDLTQERKPSRTSRRPGASSGARRRVDYLPMVATRSPGVAAVLAVFIPGLGHLYAGQIAFGLGYMLGVPFLFVAPMLLVGATALGGGHAAAGAKGALAGYAATVLIGYALGFALWVWQIFDAYNVSSRPDRHSLRRR